MKYAPLFEIIFVTIIPSATMPIIIQYIGDTPLFIEVPDCSDDCGEEMSIGTAIGVILGSVLLFAIFMCVLIMAARMKERGCTVRSIIRRLWGNPFRSKGSKKGAQSLDLDSWPTQASSPSHQRGFRDLQQPRVSTPTPNFTRHTRNDSLHRPNCDRSMQSLDLESGHIQAPERSHRRDCSYFTAG